MSDARDDIASILSEDNMFTQQESKPSLMSPERAITRYPGKDEKTLRALAVVLAKDGQEVMSQTPDLVEGQIICDSSIQTSWLISKIL